MTITGGGGMPVDGSRVEDIGNGWLFTVVKWRIFVI
jgi:hypothetical protein